MTNTKSDIGISDLPFAYMEITCEAAPHIVRANDQMLALLGIGEDDSGWKEHVTHNLLYLVPFDERDRLRNKILRPSKTPVVVAHHFVREDGTQVYVNGAFCSLAESLDALDASAPRMVSAHYMKVPERGNAPRVEMSSSMFRALKSAYTVIFEAQLDCGICECVHGKDTSLIGALYDVQMTIQSAREFWVNNYVAVEDCEKMEDFLDAIQPIGAVMDLEQTMQLDFHLSWSNGNTYFLTLVAVALDDETLLLCCRPKNENSLDIPSVSFEEELALRYGQKLHSIVRSKLGARAFFSFDRKEDRVFINYASPSILLYLGFDQNEVAESLESGIDLKELARRSGLGLKQLEELDDGCTIEVEARNSLGAKEVFQVKIERLSKQDIDSYDAYIYSLPETKSSFEGSGVFIRTFGRFDVFVDGKPIAFSNPSEKELMALLVDRQGGSVSSDEAIEIIWECSKIDENIRARYRKLAMNLKRTLERYGVSEIVQSERGSRNLNTAVVKCDYYEYLAGNPFYQDAFHGQYMSKYSWAEVTCAGLY